MTAAAASTREGAGAIVRGARVRARSPRGMTLIEVLVVTVIAALLMGSIVLGMGALTNARLKAACTMVESAIRAAYNRASAVARPQRVVFEIDEGRIWIEESTAPMLVQENDYARTGGADPATAAEKKAAEQADKILKGPPVPKPSFRPVNKVGGFEEEADAPKTVPGRILGRSVRFREVYVQHQVEGAREGRAYLYIWPGGQTEVAYIQLTKTAKTETPTDSNTITLFVHPLTGKVRMQSGARSIRPPVTDTDASEREDRGPL